MAVLWLDEDGKGLETSWRVLTAVVWRVPLQQAWRDVAVEARVRKDELRRCIKRKKLAFTQFKQWYWEAFDSDVQVRAPPRVPPLAMRLLQPCLHTTTTSASC